MLEAKRAMRTLIADLNAKPQSEKRDKIIKNAEKMQYSDFGSDFTFPQMQLHKDLTDAGFDDLAANVEDGKYDG